MSCRIVKTNATVSATGVPTGCQIDFANTEAYPMYALTVGVVSGSVATLSVTIEATLNGTDWNPIGSPITNIAGGVVYSAITFPFLSVRGNVTTLTGTSPVLRVSVGAGRYFQG